MIGLENLAFTTVASQGVPLPVASAMSAATLELGAPLDNTMGSMLLGVIMSAILYGISLLQTLFYLPVSGWFWPAQQITYGSQDMIETLCGSYGVPRYLALVLRHPYDVLLFVITTRYGNDLECFGLEALPTGITAGLVQSFYAYRIWRMSHRNVLLTGAILLLVVATATCGTAWVVLALKAGTYENLLAISPLTLSINALSTAADVIITSTLCFMLHRTRPASLRTETMVNRLILFTINTGLLTSLCAIASLISLIVSPTTLIYASFYFCIGRLYSNALLASLNARDIIRGHIHDVDTNFKSQTYHPSSQFSREIAAARGQGTAGPTELAIQIQRETELYGDKEYNKKECDRPEV
ncbi:hypothetical protein B0H13DRAFT_2370564 [Mycena leptocephala]|nr:hypothetical protein B0H13DRAFT_2370564 [Mycena leptocephala]